MMTKEIWKSVNGWNGRFVGLYKISNLGRVKNKRGKILKPYKDGRLYWFIQLSCTGFKRQNVKIHRLVAMEFIPNLNNKPQVNHINGDKNDNRAENLEWCTGSENVVHAIEHGLRGNQVRGEAQGNSRLTRKEVLEIRKLYKPNIVTKKQLARKFGVHIRTIAQIVTRETWKHI